MELIIPLAPTPRKPCPDPGRGRPLPLPLPLPPPAAPTPIMVAALLVRSCDARIPGAGMPDTEPGARRPEARKPLARELLLGLLLLLLLLVGRLLVGRGDEALLHVHHLLGEHDELALLNALTLEQHAQLGVVGLHRLEHGLDLLDSGLKLADLGGVARPLGPPLLLHLGQPGRVEAAVGRGAVAAGELPQLLVLAPQLVHLRLQLVHPLLPPVLVALLQRRHLVLVLALVQRMQLARDALDGDLNLLVRRRRDGRLVLGPAGGCGGGGGGLGAGLTGAHARHLALGLLRHHLSRLAPLLGLVELKLELLALALADDNLLLDLAQHRLHLAAPPLPAVLLGLQGFLRPLHLAQLLHALAHPLLGVAHGRLERLHLGLFAAQRGLEAADFREEARLERLELARRDGGDAARGGRRRQVEVEQAHQVVAAIGSLRGGRHIRLRR
ncbi:e0e1e459-1809-42f9-a27e-23cee90496db [Thermothielavioides terrestris]|uniref:E0e1e459-1809-42f9-a27e-23cee90496db n=1 Tax=Thermothielavioides terrestris TaxID=2587410 RepID=A0A446BI95_9PEZI|nr:e0e1e459-1809-42f9-a27e-23cee90496db [Thermothielavioides terrestris]